MSDDQIAVGGKVYPDQAAMVVDQHPDIPPEIKRLYISPNDKRQADADEMYSNNQSGDFQSRFLAANVPLGSSTELAGALKSQAGTLVAPQQNASPEPSGEDLFPTYPGPSPEEVDKAMQYQLTRPVDNSPVVIQGSNPLVRFTENDINTGMHVAMGLGALTFGGVKSLSALEPAVRSEKLSNLGHAQILESNGEHPDQVFKTTGWFRGQDNRWRYEIDDSKAKFNQNWENEAQTVQPYKMKNPDDPFEQIPFIENVGKKVAKLSDVMDHPELYKSYPFLKDVTVVRDPNHPSAYASGMDEIGIGHPSTNTLGTFLHEAQHMIQEHEGFAKGGMWGLSGKSYELKLAQAAREKVVEPLKALYAKSQTTGLNPEEEVEIQRLRGLAEKFNEYSKAGNKLAYENYMRLAGEVEARNVETRSFLNARERSNIHPKYSEDIMGDQQQKVIMRPGVTTPYGVRVDGEGGKIVPMAPEPTPFRRAANDNKPFAERFMEDLPKYHDEDESMIVDSLRRLRERQDKMTEAEKDAEIEKIKKSIQDVLDKEK